MKQLKVEFKPQGLTMETDREQFALALKTWRLRQNMTQKEVADKWKCSRFTIMRCEKAKPISWTQAYKIFAHLAQELKEENV